MTILCIDTATQVCSAAITVDGEPIASRIHREGANHAQLLPVYIEELLAELRQRHLSLDAVALSDGPGSYTGLRIGAATAKGLCYGLSIHLIPIHTTEVLCASYLRQRSGLTSDSEAVLCPMLDARRMEVYTALYDTAIHELTPIEAQVFDEVPTQSRESRASSPLLLFGDGAEKCAPYLPNATFVPDIVPDAAAMGHLAEDKLKAQEVIAGVNLAYYEPFYLKQFVAAQSHVKGLQ